MTTMPLNLFLPDENATNDLARSVATLVLQTMPDAPKPAASLAVAHDGPTNGVAIYLQGNLGAGKTAFARAFLQQCGVKGRIKSPSYALLESYKVSSLYFYHIDFYRFNDPREWEDAGFRDLFRPNAVVLIEWPEKAAGQLPSPDLHISLQYKDEGRTAGLRAETERGQQWLKTLTHHGPVT
jgi:tRNA threonylcarbamoyladenosine biosynthesis protein TsaE